MAAMDVARSLSNPLLPLPSPQSVSAESLRAKAASPEPHYRLSRLNTPPSSANLRAPSLISRSVSAGMTFSKFKSQKDKDRERDRESEKQAHRATTPDDRASTPSRFGFTLRTKTSFASLLSSRHDDAGSSRSSSFLATTSHPSIVVSPMAETPIPVPLPRDEDEDLGDGFDDADVPSRFVKKSAWRTRRKMKLHPYTDVPYMQAYDPVVLQCERYSHRLIRRLLPEGSPTFSNYQRNPPASALDLGCGAGLWLLDAARMWRTTQLVGFDLVDVAVPALTDGSVSNVRLVRGDFLHYALPFAKDQFELVRMANLSLCVPYKQWDNVLREVHRVLAPGGRLELLDDQTVFPYGDVPAEQAPDIVPDTLTNPTTIPQTSAHPLTPNTPRALPPTPESSAFFDSSDEEDESDDDEERVYQPDTSDSASSGSASARSSFTDTASTLVGEPSERGSVEIQKMLAPQLNFEPVHHRPFSGVDHLSISIPSTEHLATIDVTTADAGTPLTPVPPTRRDPDVPASSPSAAAPDSDSAPTTPSTISTELADEEEPVKVPTGPWSTKVTAARDLERVFSRMLATQYGMHTHPAELMSPLLARIFVEEQAQTGHVEPPMNMHLKLAPVGAAERPGVVVQGAPERRGAWLVSEKGKERGAKKGRRTGDALTPLIPRGISAKAAERLGIVGSGVPPTPPLVRRPTLDGTPEESDEDDLESSGEDESDELTEDENEDSPVDPTQLGRGPSTWVAPSEWDGPPSPLPTTLTDDAPISSSLSGKTITAASSSRTITAASSTKTIKQLGLGTSSQTAGPSSQAGPPSNSNSTPITLSHVRGGSTASTASVASALSTASMSSVTSGAWSEGMEVHRPLRFATERVQHPGLILWPATFIPVPPQELEMHATKHMQTLLGCKPALAEFVATFTDPETGARLVSEEGFEEALWEYECFRRERLNWPELPESRLEDDEMADLLTPASTRSAHHQVPRTPTADADSSSLQTTVELFGRFELTHVRSLRVFSAVKGAAPSASADL